MSEQKDPKDLNEESVSKPTEDTSENNTSETSIDEKTSSETEANSEGEDKKDNISETIEGTSEHDESKTSNNDEVTSESASNSEEKNEGEESLESDNDLAENENSGAKDQDVDEANAEDNEDHDVARRHEIELKDYHAMSLDELVLELESLVKKEKVQSIKDHVNNIKIEFDKKFNDIIEEKKEEFIAEGGNIIDFHYSSPVKKNFNTIYFNYREKRDQYYSQLKKNLNTNLKTRLGIIEELKNMIGSGESMTASFKQFKELQERWKNAGSVPRSDYNTVWNNYHHHIERFYDFLHLDREFRDMDFKYNLDQKLKIINRAEELTQEEDINRAFRELQLLHKMWKEELGPVAREFRDEIWEKFSEATRLIHDKRQAHFEKLDEKREENLKVKLEIIEQIQKLTESKITQHKDAQERIKNVNKLRDLFFKAGSVPRQKQDATWDAFRKATREFNKNKNDFYKDLKAEQYENLEKKKELIKIAEEHKDSDDFKTTTPLMKKIQNDWKKIGHVPRKDSDKIWKQFKSACNHYFDRFHANKNNEDNEEMKAFNQKRELIQKLKDEKISDDEDKTIALVKSYISKWNEVGMVPTNKRYVENKFNRALDQIFKRIDISKTDAELMKYQNRLQNLEESDDSQRIYKEQTFLRKKIDDTKSELQQLENNLQFFSVDADRNNPLVKEVYSNIDKLKDDLEMWKTKLKKIKEL
jgi:triphosphoribosyl-dephospho-CoA synthetase